MSFILMEKRNNLKQRAEMCWSLLVSLVWDIIVVWCRVDSISWCVPSAVLCLNLHSPARLQYPACHIAVSQGKMRRAMCFIFVMKRNNSERRRVRDGVVRLSSPLVYAYGLSYRQPGPGINGSLHVCSGGGEGRGATFPGVGHQSQSAQYLRNNQLIKIDISHSLSTRPRCCSRETKRGVGSQTELS